LTFPDNVKPGTNIAGLALQWNSTTEKTWQFWNWHPMLMTTGFGLLASHAIISFKALPFSHELKKAIHAITHVAAFTCACVGLACVTIYKNASGNNHIYTTHAWLGIGAFALYGLQVRTPPSPKRTSQSRSL
jgi:cytochrome b-561